MPNRHYLNLLAKEYPTTDSVLAEIINLSAICQLPKGTEYFFSDIHGEADAFAYLLGTASGVIRTRIDTLFPNSLAEADRALLSELIYRPDVILADEKYKNNKDWYRVTIFRLVQICKSVASKYTRSKVRKKMPPQFGYVLDELLHANTEENKEEYYTAIIESIVGSGVAEKFIAALCQLIRRCSIDRLHIIGDLFDRGPHADLVMEELMQFTDVDIQWGNHDIHWMGAVCGNETCVANAVRLAISYNNFDLLEDGYGINLRPLSTFAAEVYRDDPCLPFQPHLLDTNIYDPIDAALAAKMHKAIAIIQFKLEGQLIKRHKEYGMDDRVLLTKVDYAAGEIELDGVRYPMRDTVFPTIDPADPLKLTEAEAELVHTLTRSFTHNQLLGKHIRYLFNCGSIYKIFNGNLLYHGCIPMTEDGQFDKVKVNGKTLSGRAYLDEIDALIRTAYYAPMRSPDRLNAVDFMWYMWCGPQSPIFGKSRLTTFERYFVEDSAAHREEQNFYYNYVNDRSACERILREFSLDPDTSRIVNGHVPVRPVDGESPVKGGGLLFVIDGGISKAYHKKTGIGGYTLIANSHYIALAEHRPFSEVHSSSFPGAPKMQIVERFPRRVTVQDTDVGAQLQQQIAELTDLKNAYRDGIVREQT